MNKESKKNPSRHHRKSRVLGGTDDPKNISIVPVKKHKAFHLLFNHGDPQYIAQQLNDYWVDPEIAFIVVRREQIHVLSKTLKQ